jgi:hypothetical protein
LETISITPSSYTVTGTGAPLHAFTLPFRAYGHFINPTETVEITDQVVWTADATEIATIETSPDPNPGLVTPTGNGSCGLVNVTAAAGKNIIGSGSSNNNAVVTQTATFTVDDTSNLNCGGIQAPSLGVVESGSGTVISTPVGINCTSNANECTATYSSGTLVTLTASVPTTFSPNCITLNPTSCEIIMNASAVVSATF